MAGQSHLDSLGKWALVSACSELIGAHGPKCWTDRSWKCPRVSCWPGVRIWKSPQNFKFDCTMFVDIHFSSWCESGVLDDFISRLIKVETIWICSHFYFKYLCLHDVFLQHLCSQCPDLKLDLLPSKIWPQVLVFLSSTVEILSPKSLNLATVYKPAQTRPMKIKFESSIACTPLLMWNRWLAKPK